MAIDRQAVVLLNNDTGEKSGKHVASARFDDRDPNLVVIVLEDGSEERERIVKPPSAPAEGRTPAAYDRATAESEELERQIQELRKKSPPK